MQDAGQTDAAPSVTAELLDLTCRVIASGRHAARRIAGQVQAFGLSEAEFRLLWELRASCGERSANDETTGPRGSIAPELLSQTELGRRLGLSASQVSAVVGRLRLARYVSGMRPPGNRRRQVWQLTEEGDAVLRRCLAQLTLGSSQEQTGGAPSTSAARAVEDAA